ncbi:MAG: exopolysaccharide biosynthesis protein [Candidatus Competibacterales bacterium]
MAPVESDVPPTQVPTSTLLLNVLAVHPNTPLTLGELAERLGDRVYGVLLLLLALPNMVPVGAIPGVCTTMGILIAGLSGQLAAGRHPPWIPGFIRRYRLPQRRLMGVVTRTMPWLKRIEEGLRPRWPKVAGRWGTQGLGVLLVVLALVIALPLPASTGFPASTVAMIALGLLERDGVVMAWGGLLGLVSLGVAVAVNGVLIITLFQTFGG